MRSLVLAACGLFICAQPAMAQLTHADPEQLAAVIAGAGFPVEQTTDAVDDPQLEVKSEGTTFYIQFYGCNDAHLDCDSVQFVVAFDMSDGLDAEKALNWTRQQRFTSVYLDDDSDPFLQMDVNLDGGISEANFANTLRIWSSALSEFKDYIDW